MRIYCQSPLPALIRKKIRTESFQPFLLLFCFYPAMQVSVCFYYITLGAARIISSIILGPKTIFISSFSLIYILFRYPLATMRKNISSGVIGSHILVFLLFFDLYLFHYPLATKLKNISSGVIGSHILVFLLFFDFYLFRYPLATKLKNISSGVIGSHILVLLLFLIFIYSVILLLLS